MNKPKIYLLSIILVAVTFYTYTFMPIKFETEGGSCNQGITAMIIRFFLEICVILDLTAIILLLKSKINTPKTLIIVSVAIWFLISLWMSIDSSSKDFIIGIKYFAPFLIVNIVIISEIIKVKKAKINTR
jgi:hypothetical protein